MENRMASLPVSWRLTGVSGILWRVIALAFTISVSMIVLAQPRPPRVTIDAGTLQGTTFRSNSHAAAFLGIPYAAQPVGDLRWQPPRPPIAWRGVRKAAAYPPACPQTPSPWLPEMLGRKTMETNEACLYVNVWTPDISRSARAPVMVWVHGGGNVEGSGEWPSLGETLARHGVVVVSFNYRLGVFGFLALPALSKESSYHASGNYGQLDQIEALKWVRRNISRFGGDPANVTVFGASSGSLDICNLMASPLAAGLYQRVILQSGVCVDSVYPTLHQAEANGARFARDLGSRGETPSLVTLRSLPVEHVLQAAAADSQLDLEPVIDGWVLPEQPAITFARGRQSKVPVIVGSNANEVSIFASSLVGGKSYRPKTVSQYQEWLRREFGSLSDRVFAAYPARTDQAVLSVFNTMDTDLQFGFGARLLAQETTAIGQRVFLYRFTYTGTGRFAELGAFHSEESMFLSKKYWTSWVPQPSDNKLSETMIGYWVQFAKTGDPNAEALPYWPAFRPVTYMCQQLGRTIGEEPVPHTRRMEVFQRVLSERLQSLQQ